MLQAHGLSRSAHSGSGERAFQHAGRSIAYWLGWPSRVWRSRSVLHTLSRMSPRELADIGLTKQDIGDATALPLSADPGTLFSARVRERRRARGRR